MTAFGSFNRLLKGILYLLWRAMFARPQYIHQHDSRVNLNLALAVFTVTTAAVVTVKVFSGHVSTFVLVIWFVNAFVYAIALAGLSSIHRSKLYITNALYALSGWNLIELVASMFLRIFLSEDQIRIHYFIESLLTLVLLSLRHLVLYKNLLLFEDGFCPKIMIHQHRYSQSLRQFPDREAQFLSGDQYG